MEQLTGHEFMYIQWIGRFVPILFVLFLVNLFFLWHLDMPVKSFRGTREEFRKMYDELGPMRTGEMWCFWIFVLAIVLAFIRPLYAATLPGLKPSYVFLILGMLLFVLRDEENREILTWNFAEKNAMWGIMIMASSGLALGTMIIETGAVAKMAQLLGSLQLSGGFATLFIFCAFALFVCLMIAAILRSYVTNKMGAMRGAEEKRYYKNQLHSYEMVKENVELVNIKCHDLRRQIRLLTKNEHNEDIDKLLEIQDSLRIYDNTFKTDCDALNVVLSHESIYLNQSHVTMTVVADAKRLNDLDEVDIFSIFTNLLDNAINAANHIEEEEKRLISLTIEEKQGFLSIECRNYYAGKVDFKGSQKLPSTSKDGKYHGYGTKSIVATMRKYGGKVRFYTEDDQFIASLILPIEN